jgi:hypothetical protein
MQWYAWPVDKPRPTREEYRLAEERYKKESQALYADGSYQGDFGMGLQFVMSTYSKNIWLHFFFPDEKVPSRWFANAD